MSRTVNSIVEAMERLAPLRDASSWDNVGLLIGSESWSASSVLLSIDLTPSVLAEAIEIGADVIIAYHPPIFSKLSRVNDESPEGRIALAAISSGIAVYSPHTALDAAPGGVNDWLVGGLGRGDVRALIPGESLPASEAFKLVTFCPETAVDALRAGLATRGAGSIGAYQQCSFELRGHGTFFGGAGTSPAVGRAGGLERVPEVRLEMVCSQAALAGAIVGLRELHPYEEPPIEIYPLAPRPQRSIGEGRVLLLDETVTLSTLVDRSKTVLGVDQVKVAAAWEMPGDIQTIGVCAGAGGSLLDAALAQDCELFITGEMRHHDVLAAQARGCSVILAGHTNTERGYLPLLRERLLELIGVDVRVSSADCEPFDRR